MAGRPMLSLAIMAALASLPAPSYSGKLFFFAPIVPESIVVSFMPLMEELAKRGHQITILMSWTLKEKVPGIQVITLDSRIADTHMDMSKTMLREGANVDIQWGHLIELAMDTNERSLRHPDLHNLTSDIHTKFGVVMVSASLMSEVGYYLAHRWDAELVLFCSFQMPIPYINEAFGQPHSPALMPMFFLPSYSHPMSFLQRVHNALATNFFQLVRNWYVMPRQESMVDKYFPEDAGIRPSLLEMEKQMAVALHYGHPMIMDGMRPVAPNFQSVAMINCKQPQALSKELEQFLVSADHGVIFISFGTVFKASEMPNKKLSMMLKVLGSMKQKILWKWEKDTMPGQPANVKLAKWLPQQDILGHHKTIAFVTHGGQASFQECLCHKKPAVVIPISSDQPLNGLEAKRMGFGINIPFHDVTETNLREALLAVTSDPSYALAARERGSLLMDQETKPMDRAIWWLEFAMRHRGVGARHFRARSHDLEWHQVAMLDVFGFLIAISATVVWAVVACCRNCLCHQKRVSTSRQKTD